MSIKYVPYGNLKVSSSEISVKYFTDWTYKIFQLSRSAGSVPDELRLWFKEQQINYTQKSSRTLLLKM